MKTKRIMSIVLTIFMLIAIVAVAPSASAVTNEVSLIYARPVPNTNVAGTGFIEVENLGYDKVVTVRYSANNGEWKEVQAEYFKPTWGNKEAWSFTIPEEYAGMRGTMTFKFAIKYEVNGQEYWDNNNGQDYKIRAGYGISPEFAFGSGGLAYWNASKKTEGTVIALQLKNLGYDKDVRVRYTTDNWQTYKEEQGYYVSSIADTDVERWEVYVPTIEPFEFALSYTVNGVTYWDNNFGENYIVE